MHQEQDYSPLRIQFPRGPREGDSSPKVHSAQKHVQEAIRKKLSMIFDEQDIKMTSRHHKHDRRSSRLFPNLKILNRFTCHVTGKKTNRLRVASVTNSFLIRTERQTKIILFNKHHRMFVTTQKPSNIVFLYFIFCLFVFNFLIVLFIYLFYSFSLYIHLCMS